MEEQIEMELQRKMQAAISGANQLITSSLSVESGSAEQNKQADGHGMVAGLMKVATKHTLEKLDPLTYP